MFSHITVGALDLEKSKIFYDAALGGLGIPAGQYIDESRIIYATPTGLLVVMTPINGSPATSANGGTVGFAAGSSAQVDAWHAAGVSAGGTSCEDPPGVRDMGNSKLYLAYLRDPTGNKLCALYNMPA